MSGRSAGRTKQLCVADTSTRGRGCVIAQSCASSQLHAHPVGWHVLPLKSAPLHRFGSAVNMFCLLRQTLSHMAFRLCSCVLFLLLCQAIRGSWGHPCALAFCQAIRGSLGSPSALAFCQAALIPNPRRHIEVIFVNNQIKIGDRKYPLFLRCSIVFTTSSGLCAIFWWPSSHVRFLSPSCVMPPVPQVRLRWLPLGRP